MRKPFVSRIMVFFLLTTLSIGVTLGFTLQNSILSRTLTIEVEIISSLDTTPPTVIAVFDSIDVEEDEGIFNIYFIVEDDYDPDPITLAILQIVPENVDEWEIDTKTRSEMNIEVNYDKKEIDIKSNNPEDLWNEIQAKGGLEVDNNTLVYIELKDEKVEIECVEDNVEIELKKENNPSSLIDELLNVTAVDAAGNSAFDTATPIFDDDTDDDDDNDDEKNPDDEDIPGDEENPNNKDNPDDEATSGWELVPCLIILTISVFLLNRRRKKQKNKQSQ
ncbi:MAG: hypothetical protein ACFFDT_15605 [Candidatus Hodarchaeota archaeon]